MKVVILAGCPGARIGEEANLKPELMVKIGGNPISDFHLIVGYP